MSGRLKKGETSVSAANKANITKISCFNLFKLLCDVNVGKEKLSPSLLEVVSDQNKLATYKNETLDINGCSKGSLRKYAKEYFKSGVDELNILTKQIAMSANFGEKPDIEADYFSLLNAYLDLLSICEREDIKSKASIAYERHINRFGFVGRAKAEVVDIAKGISDATLD